MDNDDSRTERQLSVCLVLLLIATFVINMLSGYLRHVEAGLGCADWPHCYGQVGAPATVGNPAFAALTPADAVKRAHRTIATLAVLLVAWAAHRSRQLRLRGMTQSLPYLMIGVILLLAVVGPASYLKTLPAIASVNLLGGMALLALTWWLWLATRAPAGTNPPVASAPLARTALLVLLVQLALGAWVSANFAGAACTGLWECEARESSRSLWSGLWYLRELNVDGNGRIVVEQVQVYIHLAHRVGALITTLVLGWCGIAAMREGGRIARWGSMLLVLLACQLALGVAALALQLPLVVVLGHNLIASLLLLCALSMALPATVPVDRTSRVPV